MEESGIVREMVHLGALNNGPMPTLSLIPIPLSCEMPEPAFDNEDCKGILEAWKSFYPKIGYEEPWIGYFAIREGVPVGGCAFKGAPKNGKVEIAYGTFPAFQRQGVATEMTRLLVRLAQKTDPEVKVTAQTLPTNRVSAKVLVANGFAHTRNFLHEEDGEVLEWEYRE